MMLLESKARGNISSSKQNLEMMDHDKMCSPTLALLCNKNPSVSVGVYLEVSFIAKKYQDVRVDARIMFLDIVLPLFFEILNQLVNKDTQRELVPEESSSLIVFLLGEALLEEWLQAL